MAGSRKPPESSDITAPGAPRDPLPRLCVICDEDVCGRFGWTLPDYAAACLDSGARFLQVRAKHASGAHLAGLVEEVMRHAGASGALIVVNDRVDVAMLAGASGVHVGQDDLPPASVRHLAGGAMRIGLSTHTAQQVHAGVSEPIDYLAIGPVFRTSTKLTGHDAVGLSSVTRAADVATRAGIPVVAIGGITLDTAPAVIRAGAASVAVIADLLSAGDPAARVRAYLDRL